MNVYCPLPGYIVRMDKPHSVTFGTEDEDRLTLPKSELRTIDYEKGPPLSRLARTGDKIQGVVIPLWLARDRGLAWEDTPPF